MSRDVRATVIATGTDHAPEGMVRLILTALVPADLTPTTQQTLTLTVPEGH